MLCNVSSPISGAESETSAGFSRAGRVLSKGTSRIFRNIDPGGNAGTFVFVYFNLDKLTPLVYTNNKEQAF